MSTRNEFEIANSEKSVSIGREFIEFLAENKKWWLLPIVIVLLSISVLAFLATTGAAPFIYTLF